MLNNIVQRTIANKKAKGFPLYDISGDIERIRKELIELDEAEFKDRGGEIADIIIFCCGIAGYSNMNLEEEVLKKMEKIEKRIITIENGEFKKKEGSVL